MEQSREILRRSHLFSELSDDELERIAELGREESYEPGEIIFAEGSPAEKLYVVEQGKVALEMGVRLGPGARRRGTIEVITEGGAFGWSAAVGSHPFTMSARCIEQTKVLSLDGASLQLLFQEDNHLGYEVIGKLVDMVYSRLKHVRQTLANILSIASHDLKAPLAAVESYNRVILSGFAGEISEKQKQMLSRNSERIKELLELIDNILDISRVETAQLDVGTVSLLEVAKNAMDSIRPLAEEKGIELKAELPGELPQVRGSRARLQQVLTNLLGNAVKFTPAQGSIALKMKDENDHIEVDVADTGTGISAEDLPRIFDDFYRGITADSKGAGLGLSIAKRIVEAHRGRIWVESPCPETGKGSKFIFTLPKSGR